MWSVKWSYGGLGKASGGLSGVRIGRIMLGKERLGKAEVGLVKGGEGWVKLREG